MVTDNAGIGHVASHACGARRPDMSDCRSTIVLCATLLPSLGSAQSFGTGAVGRDLYDRLSGSRLTTPASQVGPKTLAEEPAWSISCEVGLKVSTRSGGTRVLAAPLGCEAEKAAWAFGVSSDGYTRQSGAGAASGVADVDIYTTYTQKLSEVTVRLLGNLTVPSHSDVGSDKPSLAFGGNVAITTLGKFKPSASLTFARIDGITGTSAASVIGVEARTAYAWTPAHRTTLAAARTTVSRSPGVSGFFVRHRMSLSEQIALEATVRTDRSGGAEQSGGTLQLTYTF
jgi:hypothetical protein